MRMLLKMGMENGEWGMGNGEWEMVVSAVDKETRIARGKQKKEKVRIFLSVFPEFLELLSFCL